MNARRRAFADAYEGNATEAAIKAGYSEKTARIMGAQLLTNPNIADAIREREQKRRGKLIADREARQIFWTAIMRDENEDIKIRLRASELLAKSEGDFISRVEMSGAGGGAIELETKKLDLSMLTDDELRLYAALAAKADGDEEGEAVIRAIIANMVAAC